MCLCLNEACRPELKFCEGHRGLEAFSLHCLWKVRFLVGSYCSLLSSLPPVFIQIMCGVLDISFHLEWLALWRSAGPYSPYLWWEQLFGLKILLFMYSGLKDQALLCCRSLIFISLCNYCTATHSVPLPTPYHTLHPVLIIVDHDCCVVWNWEMCDWCN